MKLGRLEIHNVASIEHAVIDFGAPPLAGASLFLICGPTGAGKSTILDAVCLALYGRTPRMARTPGRDHYMAGNGVQAEEAIQVNDNRQLLRRGAGEGWCSLQFEDNSGNRWTARWTARRAHRKVAGRLQQVQRTLCRERDGQTWQKTDEVNRMVADIAGQTFDEFCRTSMLAQGEFTRFLQSSPDEKAAILEKLTGTEKYTAIGRRIYETFAARRDAWLRAQESVRQIVLLTPEEKEAIAGEMERTGRQIEEAGQAIASLNLRLQWLREGRQLKAVAAGRRRELEELTRQKNADIWMAEEALVRDYGAATGGIVLLNELQKAAAGLTKEEREESALKAKMASLMAGRRQMSRALDKARETLQTLEAVLSAAAVHQTMYEKVGEITGILQHMEEGRRSIDDMKRQIAAVEKTLGEQTTKIAAARKACSTAVAAVEATTAAIAKERQLREAMKPEETRRRSETLSQHLQDVTVARACAEQHRLVTEELKRATVRRNEALRLRRQTDGELGQLKLAAEKAGEDYRQRKQTYDKLEVSQNDLVRDIRHRLATGDVCPVCGQRVEHCIDEARFTSVLEPLRLELEASATALQKAIADVKACEKTLRRLDGKEIPDCEKLLHDASVQERQVAAKTVQAFGRCGIAYTAGNPQEADATAGEIASSQAASSQEALEALNTLDRRLADEKKGIAEVMIRIDNSNRLIDELTRKKDRQAAEAEEARKWLSAAETAEGRCKAQLEQMMQNVGRLTAGLDRETEQADGLISYDHWQQAWERDMAAFRKKLTNEAAAFITAGNRRDETARKIEKATEVAAAVDADMEKILQTLPQWNGMAPAAVYTGNLGAIAAEASALMTEVAGWNGKIRLYRQQKAEKTGALERFYADSRIGRERLAELARHKDTEIAGLQAAHTALDDKLKLVRGALTQLEAQLQAHDERRPAGLEDADTPENLVQRIDETTALQRQLSEAKSRAAVRLEEDARRRESQKEALEGVERLRKDYEHWSAFNDVFGSADGRKLRNIAQSFILSNLLDRANRYLARFTDRYTLTCNPDSLYILVEDACSSAPPQSANILSGGESFMVSLSLALALAHTAGGATMDTLFIDEGFGTLDSECLGTVIETLERLHQTGGRRVGVISHVDELQSRITTQIRVERRDPSRSDIRIIPAECGT